MATIPLSSTRHPHDPTLRAKVIAGLVETIWNPRLPTTYLERIEAVQMLGQFHDAAAQQALLRLLEEGGAGIQPAEVGHLLRDTALDTLLRSPAQRSEQTLQAIRRYYSFWRRLRENRRLDRVGVYDDIPVLLRQGAKDMLFLSYVRPLILLLVGLLLLAEILFIAGGTDLGLWSLLGTPAPTTTLAPPTGGTTETPTLGPSSTPGPNATDTPLPTITVPGPLPTAPPVVPSPSDTPVPVPPTATPRLVPTLPPSGGGPILITMPDLANTEGKAAETYLVALGLHVTRQDEPSQAVPAGYVTHQVPTSGQRVNSGDTVTLWISQGDVVPLPDVVGLSLAQAQATLQQQNLTVQIVDTNGTPIQVDDKSIPVSHMEPPADTLIPRGSTVSITVITPSVTPTGTPGATGSPTVTVTSDPTVLPQPTVLSFTASPDPVYYGSLCGSPSVNPTELFVVVQVPSVLAVKLNIRFNSKGVGSAGGQKEVIALIPDALPLPGQINAFAFRGSLDLLGDWRPDDGVGSDGTGFINYDSLTVIDLMNNEQTLPLQVAPSRYAHCKPATNTPTWTPTNTPTNAPAPPTKGGPNLPTAGPVETPATPTTPPTATLLPTPPPPTNTAEPSPGVPTDTPAPTSTAAPPTDTPTLPTPPAPPSTQGAAPPGPAPPSGTQGPTAP